MQVPFAVQYVNGRPIAFSALPTPSGDVKFVELNYSQILATLNSPTVHVDPVSRAYYVCVFSRGELSLQLYCRILLQLSIFYFVKNK